MVDAVVLILAVFFTVLFAVVVVLLMRILSILEIVVRAIPLGTPRIQERRAPAPAPMGAHRRDTAEVQ